MRAHLVGSGLASLAAATYLIRDGQVFGNNITIYEAHASLGGGMTMLGGPDQGYVLPTGRLFEKEYRCAFELFSLVPSATDPRRSITEEILEFNERYGYDDRLRILDRGGHAVRSERFGLTWRNRIDLMKLALTPEEFLDGKAISDFFTEDFFVTEFWILWATLMGSLPQHSAIEFRRFMYRFLHLLPDLSTMKTILRTRLNQYEALVVPISHWLKSQGVIFLTEAMVTNVEFRPSHSQITAKTLEYVHNGKPLKVEIGDDDLVLVTNGSQVSGLTIGSMSQAPERRVSDADWSLWRRLASARPEFGKPETFFGERCVPDTKWLTYTVTTRDPRFFELMTELTGSEPGRGGLMTLKDSNWLITVAIFHQPEFLNQPRDVMAWWGFALYPDKRGNFIEKPMTECSGAEILEETVRHVGFDDDLARIVGSSTCIPCFLPYAGSVWMVRGRADRPKAVPDGSTNFGFIGQFCEIPDEPIFTMEYSVRSARAAVAALLNLDRGPPPIYQAHHDPKVLERVFEALI